MSARRGVLILMLVAAMVALGNREAKAAPSRASSAATPLTTAHSPLATVPLNTAPLTTDHLIVSPAGPYTTIAAALADAQPGATIEVHGGVYPALVVDKPVTLIGSEHAVVDAGGQGTVVQLTAPAITFRGFEVRGSGDEPDRDHSGLIITGNGAVVEDNVLDEVLFGIFVSQADNVTLRGNTITGKAKYEEARRGDAIRLWYAHNVLIENNTVHDVRDLVIWYSKNVTLRGNHVHRARYGIHLMYADDTLVENNQFVGNAVGIYTMYSKRVRLLANELRGQRGPSGYALGFKDSDDIEVAGNYLIDNRAGLFVDAAPFSPQGTARFQENVIAFNDVGAILLTSTRRAALTGNTFWENLEQVAIQGGGDLSRANTWQGNYWSDYAGFDVDGDGVGDTPYQAERFFEGLTDREPLLRALIYSPAAQALEFAGAALPIFKPQPKLTDPAPSMRPAPIPAALLPEHAAGLPLAGVALGLLVVTVVGGALAARPGAKPMLVKEGSAAADAPAVLTAAGVTKRYGRAVVLDGVGFEARRGEALALWGANGAGKSTLIKAILGLIEFDGAIAVQGQAVRQAGKAARRAIGYVPQDVVFYEQSVRATLAYFARLKKAPAARIPALLERLGLAEHAQKPVSTLSGGLRQRLALAVALLSDPPVLLLDEPTANLDAQAQRDYLALLASLCKHDHKTILFASHRLEEVELLANRVLMLEHGRLVDTVSPSELLARLMPFVKLTLLVPEAERPAALARFTGAGFNAHLNGRGTVVVQVRAEEKLQLLKMLETLSVVDFEMERGAQWK